MFNKNNPDWFILFNLNNNTKVINTNGIIDSCRCETYAVCAAPSFRVGEALPAALAPARRLCGEVRTSLRPHRGLCGLLLRPHHTWHPRTLCYCGPHSRRGHGFHSQWGSVVLLWNGLLNVKCVALHERVMVVMHCVINDD